MDSSVGSSELTVIRIGEQFNGNWPAEVQEAVGVLTAFVEQSLAAETNGAGAGAGDPSGSELRESAETAAKKLADAETESPGQGAGGEITPMSACGAVDAGPAIVASGPEIVLVRGRNAYETVSQALG